MITAILIVLFATAAKLMHDVSLWKRYKAGKTKRVVNHALEWFILVIICIYPIYVFSKQLHIHWFLSFAISGAMVAGFIWFFFDGPNNALRGFNWWFLGSVDKDDANSDKFLRRLKPWQQKTVKFAALIIPTAIYLYILLKK